MLALASQPHCRHYCVLIVMVLHHGGGQGSEGGSEGS